MQTDAQLVSWCRKEIARLRAIAQRADKTATDAIRKKIVAENAVRELQQRIDALKGR